jgi:guanylate kinase
MSNSSASPAPGELFIVSAPSGAGKTTLVRRVIANVPALVESVSYASRAIRPGEQPGLDYNFISRAEFEAMIARGEFLEWADVFGNLYGTRALDTGALLDTGEDVVLVIDVQGARQVRQARPDAVSIFVTPPSFAALEARLRGRGQDGEEVIQRRLAAARVEMAAIDEYDYIVVNDDLESAVDRLRSIVVARRARRKRQRETVERIRATFRVE